MKGGVLLRSKNKKRPTPMGQDAPNKTVPTVRTAFVLYRHARIH